MSGLNRSSNPYLSSIKPRVFFQKRNEMLKKEKLVNSGRKFDPDWNKGKSK